MVSATRSVLLARTKVSPRAMSEDERQAAGVSGGLLRLAVGVESVESLWADLEQALAP